MKLTAEQLKENWNIFETYILHAGKVPEYRGASVINWQILNKEKEIFLSALKYSNKYDAGQIVLQSKIKISNSSSNFCICMLKVGCVTKHFRRPM